MSTYTTTGTFTNTSDATFREWVARVIECLTAVGLVRTTDTGQIDTATVLRPTVVSTVAGFAVFRFADTAQATAPLFLRVNFGSGANATYPGLQVIVCKGTDGAGNPVGVLASTFLSTSGRSTTAVRWVACGGPGYVALLPCADVQSLLTAGSGMPFLFVERSPDATSVLVVEVQRSNWALAGNSNVSNTPACFCVAYDTAAATVGMPPVILPYRIAGNPLAGGTPLAAAALAPVFPWVLFPPSQAPWQSRMAVSYPGGDAPGSAFAVTLEGEDRTYLPVPLSDAYHAFGVAIGSGPDSGAASRYVGLAVRWE